MEKVSKIITILILMFIMAGCSNRPAETTFVESENIGPESSSESVETAERRTSKLFDFSVNVSDDRELTVSLLLSEASDSTYTTEVSEVQIYDGESLLQTITKDDIPEVSDYAWDGLFLYEGSQVGLPDVRDLNFDGAEDFGLLAVSVYPQNVPYSYFFWNAEKEMFEYQFTAFGPGWLQIDEAEKRLVEISTTGAETYKKYFTFRSDGSIEISSQAEEPFDTTPVTIDGYVYWGGDCPDGSPNHVSVTMALSSVMHGEEAYNYLLQSDPELEAPAPGHEYIVVTLNVKYENGDLDVLDMTENIARQPGYSLRFALQNEDGNADDVTCSLADPIYNMRLSKGESASGSVAFLQEIGNTQPLVFDGFDEITEFEIQNEKEKVSYTTWQEAYLYIIHNLSDYLVDAEEHDLKEEYGYLGIHDFDGDGTPELIAGDLDSLAVFTFADGEVKKLADLFYPDIVWCVNGVHFNGRSILAQCDGAGGSSFVSFGYLDGQYVLGMYSETSHPNPVIINGEESTLEQMNRIYNLNVDENDSGKSVQRIRRYFDGGTWQMQTLNGEIYTLDDSFDFEHILWKE